ncbi:NEW3 domain-containing protein [Candidatus Nanohalococcus occultus]|uniref:Membrane protein n=1 Tax=Candidatus Nanohalococcus occultus TaxID=2978047 RepID=A0ABY8CDV4_9ARCH|nr:Putative membrane protein [Candidatus Nanohaloarchaeota archaeon SVXNc]
MRVLEKTALIVLSAVLLSSMALAYSNTDDLKVYKGEKADLGNYSFSYIDVPDRRLEISEERQDSRFILEQATFDELYGQGERMFDFPTENLWVRFNGLGWSDRGSYMNLTVSSDEDIFSDAKLTADVPRRVIAARGDEISVPLTLENSGTQNKTYNLSVNDLEGILVTYNYQGFNVSSIEVPAGEKFDITATIEVLESAKAQRTGIVFRGESSRNVTEEINLEVRGAEKTRQLDFEISENYITTWPGKQASLNVEFRNRGQAPITNLETDIQAPENWEVESRGLERPKDVLAQYDRYSDYYTVKVPGNVEAGDYYITVDPSSDNLDIEAKEIRVHVRTKSGLSYIGVGLIFVSLLGMGGTYWKLGRR